MINDLKKGKIITDIGQYID
jgi:hypothetical protein